MFTSSGPESSTGDYSGTLKDSTGAAVQLSDLTSLTITLRQGETDQGAIINSRNAQDVKNANNGTFHATSGLFTWKIQVADMAIQKNTSSGQPEARNAVFTAVWSTGAWKWKIILYSNDL